MRPADPRTVRTLGPVARRTQLARLAGVGIDVGGSTVLRAVDLELFAGEAVGLVGENGSGKTTLLHLLATLRRPAAGTAQVLGADLAGTAPAGVRRQICLVGHQPALYPQLTLRENLMFSGSLLGRSEADVEEALAVVGLARAAHRRTDACSFGMTRRADLARAVVARPRLLLLDEAHAGLDQEAAHIVQYLADEVRRGGGCAVVVSHERERLARLVDRSLMMRHGGVVAVGEPS